VTTKPFDRRVADALVRALYDTPVSPSQVTTAALLVGLAAAGSYAAGYAQLGALLFVASAILDHADGQLAQAQGTTSWVGHVYDRVTELVVKIALFAGMGAGLRHGPYGWWMLAAGAIAGVAFVSIFLARGARARRIGQTVLAPPSAGPFELEDVLYLIVPLTWAGWLEPFLLAAAIGAPIFAAWSLWKLWNTPVPLRSAVPPPAAFARRSEEVGEPLAAP